MATIEMTPENKPYIEALMRIVAIGRDADAEQKILDGIMELMATRAALNEVLTAAVEALQDEGVADWGDGGRLGDALIGIKDAAQTALGIGREA